MKHIFKLPAYVGIILLKEREVFLVQRHNTDWATGLWNFPGGLLEEHESLVCAAVREAHEEIGVTIDADALELVHVIQVHAGNTNTQDILGFYFLAKEWQGEPINNEPDRHARVGWFSVEAMPQNSTAHAMQALDGLIKDIRYSQN